MADQSDHDDAHWRRKLTPEQYQITRRGGTEPPFTGIYHNCKEPGLYRCICCEAPLFSAATKYDSGSGWPSFYQPVSEAAVRTLEDFSHGMHRTEVRCANCNAHLGHVFGDGPNPTGLRFCINSVSLDLDREPDSA